MRPLVEKFVASYATFGDDLTNDLANGDRESAIRRAHSLRGIAGTLLSDQLSEDAGALEIAMTDDDNIGQHVAHEKVISGLATLIASMREALNA